MSQGPRGGLRLPPPVRSQARPGLAFTFLWWTIHVQRGTADIQTKKRCRLTRLTYPVTQTRICLPRLPLQEVVSTFREAQQLQAAPGLSRPQQVCTPGGYVCLFSAAIFPCLHVPAARLLPQSDLCPAASANATWHGRRMPPTTRSLPAARFSPCRALRYPLPCAL